MKIFAAIFVNAFLIFVGFTLLLLSGYSDKPASLGWIGGGRLFDFKSWLYLSAFLSLVACIPVGVINGLIFGGVKNNILTAVLSAVGLSLFPAIFFLNLTEHSGDFPWNYVIIFFIVCCLCNVATVYILKWKFSDSL